MEPAYRRSKREHQPSTKATVSSTFASISSNVSRRSQRRRVSSSAVGVSIATTARGTVTLPASSHIVTNAVGYDGNRRRLRAVAHRTSVPSVTPQRFHSTYLGDEKKVLGRYSSHDCVILCKTILGQLKSQTLAPTVLDEAKSPASIRWKQVAKEMETTQSLQMTPRDCQVLWRFLAYGQLPKLEAGEDLESDSDSDEIEQSPEQINARLAAERAKVSEKKQKELRGTNGESQRKAQDAATGETGATSEESQIESKDKEEGDALGERRHDMDTSMKLCPTYELPTGTPDAWYRPFGPRDALPLAFVASRFLRRKPTPTPVPPSQNGISTALPGASATGLLESKRKQTEGLSSADVAKKLKLVTPPTSTSLLPATPSPVRTRARSDLDFFELCLREDHNKTTPGTKFEISTADLKRQFLKASPEIRRRCQELALEDSERFHRNSAPERIWQKATEADTMNSNPTLKSEAEASEAAEGGRAASAGTIDGNSTKALSPAAALLAHVAAVTKDVANSKSSSSPKQCIDVIEDKCEDIYQ